MFPVEDEDIKRRVNQVIDLNLADNVNARELLPDGHYELPDRRGHTAVNSQLELYRLAKEALREKEKEPPVVI